MINFCKAIKIKHLNLADRTFVNLFYWNYRGTIHGKNIKNDINKHKAKQSRK